MKYIIYNIRVILTTIGLLLLAGNIFAQQGWDTDFQRQREFKLLGSNQIADTIYYPIGDTLTIIQRPLLNIPVIATPGDTIKIECEADLTTTGWRLEIHLRSFKDHY